MYQTHANSHIAANMIAAAERHAADIARAERLCRLRAYEGEANRSHRVPGYRSVRDTLGLLLIRARARGHIRTAPRELARAR